MDDLSHYLECDFLWDIVISSANLGVEFLDLDPLSRAGLNDPSWTSCSLLACAFLLCHALKLGHLEESLNAIALDDLTHISNLARKLAADHMQTLGMRS